MSKSKSATVWHMDEEKWYATTLAHWTSSSIKDDDNEGVLGGWGQVDAEDVRGSLEFLSRCLDVQPEQLPLADFNALDCGAGVGRVAGNVLLNVAATVELLEVSERLLGQAQRKLAAHEARLTFTQASLREFKPPPGTYNLVWAQWVLGHLTDTDVVGLLSRCREALRPNGAVGVKDNTAAAADCDQCGGKYLLDEENAAVIRSHTHLKSLFQLAGLQLVRTETQTGFPEDLHPVRMYWLRPA
jgi:protein N-terminal methyltransferase